MNNYKRQTDASKVIQQNNTKKLESFMNDKQTDS